MRGRDKAKDKGTDREKDQKRDKGKDKVRERGHYRGRIEGEGRDGGRNKRRNRGRDRVCHGAIIEGEMEVRMEGWINRGRKEGLFRDLAWDRRRDRRRMEADCLIDRWKANLLFPFSVRYIIDKEGIEVIEQEKKRKDRWRNRGRQRGGTEPRTERWMQ